MSIDENLLSRSESKCELCNSSENLSEYMVSPRSGDDIDDKILTCSICKAQIEDSVPIDVNHWRCLNESMWSPVPAVQVVTYRMLEKLKGEGWAQDALGTMYLDDETMEWAKSGVSNTTIVHKDSNGNVLESGDTVTLIQDLNVKGASFTAKRGTAVRRIRLVHDNPEHIEGKVDGQQIVILTKYVKKST